MEKILVPTDFSANALNAARFAFNLARQTGAQLHLVHIYHIRSGNPFQSVDQIVKLEKQAEKEAEFELQRFVDNAFSLFPPDIRAEVKQSTSVRLGFAIEEIIRLSEEISPDLIVMGTKGVSDLTSKVLGSNTAFVIENTGCPVLAVPASIRYNGINTIVHTFNHGNEAQENHVALADFAASLKAKLVLVNVGSKADEGLSWAKQLAVTLQSSCPGLNITTDAAVSTDVFQAIDAAVVAHQADVISLSSASKSLYQKIFHPRLTMFVHFQLSLPLLAIPAQKA